MLDSRDEQFLRYTLSNQLDTDKLSAFASLVRSLALSSDVGRWISYLSIEAIIVLATRPREGHDVAK